MTLLIFGDFARSKVISLLWTLLHLPLVINIHLVWEPSPCM